MTDVGRPAGLEELYGPVLGDMPRVEAAILEVGNVPVPWLSTLVKHVLGQTGKRMRPAMTLLAGKFGDYNLDVMVPMAASVELLHTASLVHDDTLDEASLRRGNPTVNQLWNKNVAVLFGDYVFAAAAEMVSRTSNVRVMRLFAQTLRIICDGELAQNFAAYQWDAGRDQYFQRIGGKTASLFSMATESGAALSGLPEPQVQALKRYGHSLGMAFQVADDILDFTGEETAMGKAVGGDLIQGTVTLPAIMLVERDARGNAVRRYLEGGRTAEDLNAVLRAVRESDVIERCYEVANGFRVEACQALAGFPAAAARACLERLTEYALARRS